MIEVSFNLFSPLEITYIFDFTDAAGGPFLRRNDGGINGRGTTTAFSVK
jgi:hypothetical protein